MSIKYPFNIERFLNLENRKMSNAKINFSKTGTNFLTLTYQTERYQNCQKRKPLVIKPSGLQLSFSLKPLSPKHVYDTEEPLELYLLSKCRLLSFSILLGLDSFDFIYLPWKRNNLLLMLSLLKSRNPFPFYKWSVQKCHNYHWYCFSLYILFDGFLST